MLEVLEDSGRTGVLSFGRGGCIGCICTGGVEYFHAVEFVVGDASVS